MASTEKAHGLHIEHYHGFRYTSLAAYIATMAVTFAALAASLAFILAFAPGASVASKLAIAVFVVGATAFGALAGRAEMDEIGAVIEEGIAGQPGRHAAHVGALPITLFSALTVILTLAIGLTQLYALYVA